MYKRIICIRFCIFYIGFWFSYGSVRSEIDYSFVQYNLIIIFVHHGQGRISRVRGPSAGAPYDFH